MNRVCFTIQWFVQLVPCQCIVSQWNTCFLKPNKPLQYAVAEHGISIYFPLTNENKDSGLSSLSSPDALFFEHVKNLARIQQTPLSKYNVFKKWLLCLSICWFLWNLTLGPFVLCACSRFLRSLGNTESWKASTNNSVRDTWIKSHDLKL